MPLTISGGGTGGNGALDASQGGNSFAGAITLAANSQINVDYAADTLALAATSAADLPLPKAGRERWCFRGAILLPRGSTCSAGR